MNAPPPPRARRSLGQNFLVDRAVVERIVAALAIERGDAVLEIGPGHGALTLPLLARGARVIAIERDRRLALALRERGESGLTVVEADVLDLDLLRLAREHGLAEGWIVAGNLPYNISKPIAMLLVRQRRAVARAVLMFQREVAQRLTARAGSKQYAPLTVLTGAVFAVEALFEIGPGAFRPRPKVVSSVTRWTSRTDAPDESSLTRLSRCLRACFAARRRTLRNNLRSALGDERSAQMLARASIDGARRAESLDPAELDRLAAFWPDGPPAQP